MKECMNGEVCTEFDRTLSLYWCWLHVLLRWTVCNRDQWETFYSDAIVNLYLDNSGKWS